MALKKQHLSSNLEDQPFDQGSLADTTAVAIKRVLANQIAEAMKEQRLSHAAMARRMRASQSAVDHLLDPDSPSVSLLTLTRAAKALNKALFLQLF